jgi:hypothetical protein
MHAAAWTRVLVRGWCLVGSAVHVYAKVTSMPVLKRFTRVCAEQQFDVDLLSGDHCNVWEPPDREFVGGLKTYQWSELAPFFDVEEVPRSVVDAYVCARALVGSLAAACGRRTPYEADSYHADGTASAPPGAEDEDGPLSGKRSVPACEVIWFWRLRAFAEAGSVLLLVCQAERAWAASEDEESGFHDVHHRKVLQLAYTPWLTICFWKFWVPRVLVEKLLHHCEAAT